MNSWQERQLHSLLKAKTEEEFFSAVASAAAELGFENCAFGMRAPLPVSNSGVVMLNDYPSEWQARYAQCNYLAIDPTVAHGQKSVMPLVWSNDIFENCRDFWEEARSFGLKVGWAQSCHDARGVGSLLTLARSADELSPSELQSNLLNMMWLTQLSHEALSRILSDRLLPGKAISLTCREMEIMRWTADGKTSREVADIMNISTSSVNFHINNTVIKLGASNKTAAAIKAILLKLL